jgi:hypothetical protein
MSLYGGYGESNAHYGRVERTEEQIELANAITQHKNQIYRRDVDVVLQMLEDNGMACCVSIPLGKEVGEIHLHGYSIDTIGKMERVKQREDDGALKYFIRVKEDISDEM